jgi:hypothetical protein
MLPPGARLFVSPTRRVLTILAATGLCVGVVSRLDRARRPARPAGGVGAGGRGPREANRAAGGGKTVAMRPPSSRSSANWKRAARPWPPSRPAYGRCLGSRRRWLKRDWPSGGGCCGNRLHRTAPCFNAVTPNALGGYTFLQLGSGLSMADSATRLHQDGAFSGLARLLRSAECRVPPVYRAARVMRWDEWIAELEMVRPDPERVR